MHDGQSGVARRVLRTHDGTFVDDDGAAGITLAPADDVRALKLDGVKLITLTFPKASEGRPYTQAHLLRTELGYTGRLRAVGEVVVDAVSFMQRVGIDELILRDASDEEFAASVLSRFSGHYQARLAR